MDPGLRDAVRRGDAAAVAVLLLNNPALNPAADDSAAIRWAALVGHAGVVVLLLADPRVDPAALDNAAIRWAAEWGEAEVVRLLLADPRVDPAADYDSAIRRAAEHGHTETAALLLAHPRVDPAVLDRLPTFRARPLVAEALAARRRWSFLRAAFLGAWGAAARDAAPPG